LSFRVAFLTDTHLGYAARCRAHAQTGLNERVRDGYRGFRQSIQEIVEERPDVVIHGGDLFHRSHPSITDIHWARQQLLELSRAGIPFVGLTGNHDFANERGRMPATAAVHDPDRGIQMVMTPVEVLRPVDGLAIHAVSHIGLAAATRATPEPESGLVNVFTSHGAAQVPGHEIFACVDSPGEAVIGYDTLALPWNLGLLGHYHGQGALPGFTGGGQSGSPIWYGGSLLRRGFSDPAGPRGWLLATIGGQGSVELESKTIPQRPQHDLPVIDAAGLTGSDVYERMVSNLSDIEVAEAIIRQRVINCPLSVRRSVNTAQLARVAEDALVWQPEFIRPVVAEMAPLADADEAVSSLQTAGSSDLPRMWRTWIPGYGDRVGLAPEIAASLEEPGAALLEQARGLEEE
jgi:exonuclease SbcD